MIHFVHENNIYLLVKPVKSLCRSTLIHDVLTRGDVFAINVSNSALTVIARKDYENSLRSK